MAQTEEQKAAYKKEYYLRNKEKLKAYSREYRGLNSKAVKEYMKGYRLHKKDPLRNYSLEYYIRNSERIKARADDYNGKFRRLKNTAKHRKLQFDLSFEQYLSIVKGAVCTYCDSALPKRGYGLDRVSNLAGYIIENVVPCCKTCNQMFSNYDKEFVFEHMKKVLKKYKKV